jgi:hypothetical protein
MMFSRDPLPTDRELKTPITGRSSDDTEWDIVLFRDEDGRYWYQLPLGDDPATQTLFGDFARRREATAEARKHLREID